MEKYTKLTQKLMKTTLEYSKWLVRNIIIKFLNVKHAIHEIYEHVEDANMEYYGWIIKHTF